MYVNVVAVGTVKVKGGDSDGLREDKDKDMMTYILEENR